MEQIEELELEVETTQEVVKSEYITVDNYKQFLKELGNRFADCKDDFFLKNHTRRLKGLGSPRINLGNTIKSLVEYLSVIGMVECKIDKNEWNRVKDCTVVRVNNINCKLNNLNSILGKWTPVYSYFSVNVTMLPYCCGVCEYGNFSFAEGGKGIYDLDKIKYNLIMDLIRIHASLNKKEVTGAYNIINYFVGTKFTKALEERDDLTFIKEFTNPKTNKTLKTFIFNTTI